MIRAFIPLAEGVELVLSCHVCGRSSSGDLRGTDGWTLQRAVPNRQRLVDVCPCCQPRKLTPARRGAL
jgi:hypothetical protein